MPQTEYDDLGTTVGKEGNDLAENLWLAFQGGICYFAGWGTQYRRRLREHGPSCWEPLAHSAQGFCCAERELIDNRHETRIIHVFFVCVEFPPRFASTFASRGSRRGLILEGGGVLTRGAWRDAIIESDEDRDEWCTAMHAFGHLSVQLSRV